MEGNSSLGEMGALQLETPFAADDEEEGVAAADIRLQARSTSSRQLIQLQKFRWHAHVACMYSISVMGGVVSAILILVSVFGGVLVYQSHVEPGAVSQTDIVIPPHPAKGGDRPLPVFMMHGLCDMADGEFGNMEKWIQDAHPGTVTVPIRLYEGSPGSYASLHAQVKNVAQYIRNVVKAHPDVMSRGYNLVCHSQGGLTCRTLVQHMDDHNVHTLIASASPQRGVFGSTFFNFLRSLPGGPGLQKYVFAHITSLAYTGALQSTVSVANLWNDPTRQGDFLDRNTFLPLYNGLTNDTKGNAARKANFVRLKKAVFLTGIPWNEQGTGDLEYDGGIEPAQTGVFGYFKDGNTKGFVPMRASRVYYEDTFGLQTLDIAGKLIAAAVPGVNHTHWVDDEDVVRRYILPHLV